MKIPKQPYTAELKELVLKRGHARADGTLPAPHGERPAQAGERNPKKSGGGYVAHSAFAYRSNVSIVE